MVKSRGGFFEQDCGEKTSGQPIGQGVRPDQWRAGT